MYFLHAWEIPLASAFMWGATLVALMVTWAASGKPVYASQDGPIPYISDIGASYLKPLFIVGCVITGVGFFLSLLAERLLRHQRRLLPNVRRRGKVFGVLSVFFALVAAAGLILLSIFDTLRHTSLHRLFLAIFMGGTVLSALATTAEYMVLAREARRIAGLPEPPSFAKRARAWLSWSYIAKLIIVLAEIGLSVGFGVSMYSDQNTKAAVLEWTISFLFVFYVFTFYFDLRPAAKKASGTYVLDRQDIEHGKITHNRNPEHDHLDSNGDGMTRAAVAPGLGLGVEGSDGVPAAHFNGRNVSPVNTMATADGSEVGMVQNRTGGGIVSSGRRL